jgi:anaerobic magnesium-protoporphyrin IX monomethyl ester cyclase
MKVLLVQPSASPSERWGELKDIGSYHWPLGLAYVAAVLNKHKKDVDILDCVGGEVSITQLQKEILDRKPDIVGLSAMTPTLYYAQRSISAIKEVLPECLIVLGGPHVTVLPEATLKAIPQIDYAVIGEGEYTMLELVECLESGTDIQNVKGLAFNKNNRFIMTEKRPVVADLDDLPTPQWSLLPSLKNYRPAIGNYRKLPVAIIVSSRGCPFPCTICDRAVSGTKVRLRSAKHVVDEMETLTTEFGAREIIFFDDLFTVNRNRVMDICDEIIKRGLKIVWNCESRVDTVDQEMLHKMKSAGCWQVSYGIESGNQDILDSIKKGTTVKKAIDAITMTKAANLKTRGFFILGLPGETLQTMDETVAFAKSLRLDNTLFSTFVPLPGTAIYASFSEDERRKYDDWQSFRFSTRDFPYVPAGLKEKDLKEVYRNAYKSIYMRPGYILRYLSGIRTIKDLKMAMQGFFIVRDM